MELSLPARFERQAILYPSRTALGSGVWQPTYEELNAAANRLAWCLLSHGGARGDRIAVLMRHDTPLIAAVLAVLKGGRTVVVLNPTDPPARLGQVLDDAAPVLIVTDAANRQLAEHVAGEGRRVVCSEVRSSDSRSGNPKVDVLPDDLAFLVYTSGSTGRPKGVMRTHRCALRYARVANLAMGPLFGERIALLGSLSAGQGVSTTWCALLNGATLCPFPTMEKGVAGLAGWLHEHKITVYMSSASVFRHLMKTLKGGERFPRMRIVRLGSEPVTSDDFRAFQEHFADGCTLIIALSSSETGSVTQLRLGRNARVDPGRLPVGRPVEGVELLLLDEDGREVAQGETGEMVIRSRYLSPGYWRNPQLTAQRFAGNGALRTFSSGDLACIASDGLFRFMGRKDARVKVRGYRIEPSEIEETLLAQPGVRGAVVCADFRPTDDALLVAYVTAQPDGAPSAESLPKRPSVDASAAHDTWRICLPGQLSDHA